MELWAMRIPETGTVVAQAERAERAGWDGVTFTDSQNLVADPFVAVALAAEATDRLRFATGVTNAFTRHPAALANVAATVQETSGGRFVLGIGRGDTALFHLGRRPMKVDEFADLVADLQTYLANGTVDIDGFPSRMRWLDRAPAAEGPARHRRLGAAHDRARGPDRGTGDARGGRRPGSDRVGVGPRPSRRRSTLDATRTRSRSART